MRKIISFFSNRFVRLLAVLLVVVVPFVSLYVTQSGSADASAKLGSANTTTLSNGLVGYWPLDGATTNWQTNTTSDLSGNGNSCSLISMPTSTSPIAGKIGQGFLFASSSSWCQLTGISSQHPALDITGDLTVSVWMYATSTVAIQDMVRAGQGSDERYALFYDGNLKRLFTNWYDGSAFQNIYSNTNSVPLNRWIHAVVTRRGSTLTFYANGVVVGTGTFTSAPNSPSIFTIGGTNTKNQPFIGSLDDVRIYNRALSDTEVAQLYTLGQVNAGHSNSPADSSSAKASLATGLVGYWSMDGPTVNWASNTMRDLSGQGNIGTFVSVPTTTSPAAGKIGQALYFDGDTNTYMTMTANSSLGIDTGTLVAWIKTSNAGSYFRGIFTQSHAYGLYLYNNVFAAYDNGAAAIRTTGVSLNDGKWHQVAMSFISGVTNGTLLYIDGSLSLQTTITNTAHGMIRLGTGQGGTIQNFTGAIDDVRVYNRLLSASEISQLYKTGAVNAAYSNTTTLSTGLVGYWPFDGKYMNWAANTTADASGNGNTGTLVSMSTTTSPVAGKIGQGLRFDGSSSCVTTGRSLSNASAFMLIGWIYPISLGNRVGFFGQNDSIEFGFSDSTHIGGWTPNGNGGAVVEYVVGLSFLNHWHQVAFAGDAGGEYLYIDGALAASGTGASNFDSSAYAVNIGCAVWDASGNYFTGAMDDVRLYSRALSATEVAQLYATGR